MNNRALQQMVLDELDFDPSVDAAKIGVAAQDGIVTLSGHVASYAEKIAAEQAAYRVKGVRAVAQELEVRYPDDKKTGDEEIAKRALNILSWDSTIPRDAVHLTVEDGRVTLEGRVNWQYQKRAAERAILKLSGVTGVINHITLQPKVDASDIKRKIESALARRAHIGADRIRVEVTAGNKVRLEGKVDSWDQRQSVERATWSVAGVQSIDDRLTIGN